MQLILFMQNSSGIYFFFVFYLLIFNIFFRNYLYFNVIPHDFAKLQCCYYILQFCYLLLSKYNKVLSHCISFNLCLKTF